MTTSNQCLTVNTAETAIALSDAPRPRKGLAERLVFPAVGGRARLAVAAVLISVVPLLAVVCLCMTGWLGFQAPLASLATLAAAVLPFSAMGYWMLAKYPVNIVRLHRYLQSLGAEIVPARLAPAKNEDDLDSIEMLIREAMTRMETRMRTVEAQTYALLETERQRVMIQSLGAACHHLSQPATVLVSYLTLVSRMKLPPAPRAMLQECRTAAESIAGIMDRLRHLSVYRTEHYMPERDGASAWETEDILKI